MESDSVIYIIDDVPAVVDLTCRYLQTSGVRDCRSYTSTVRFLDEFVPGAADCVVADLKMPELDGDELQKRTMLKDPLVSFVFISGYADVKTAVRLMERGATTLVEKPFTMEALIAAVERASLRTRQMRALYANRSAEAVRWGELSQEEREILDCLVAGMTNKSIAQALAVSLRTVDRRRQSVLQKMKVDSVAELAELITRLKNPPL